MRRILFAIAVLCAVLSGWTSAVAQLQGVSGGQADAGLHHLHADHQAAAHCPEGCPHPAKSVHPMLCSACFAVEVSAPEIDRVSLAGARLRPAVLRPLAALSLQPTPPPPKTAFPI